MQSEQKCVGASPPRRNRVNKGLKERRVLQTKTTPRLWQCHIHHSYPHQFARKTGSGWQPGLIFMEDGVSRALQQSTTLQLLLNPKGHKRSIQKHACYIRKNPRNLTSGILYPLHHTQVIFARPLGRTPPGACRHVGASMQMNEIYDKMSVIR